MMPLSIPGMGRRSNTLLLLIAVAANLHSANTNQSSTSQDAAVSSFSCVEKVIGGYYADISLGCTMFHVCTLGEKGEIRDIIFKCVPGTLFSQEKRVCEREDEVNCPNSEQFYHLNNELYGPGIIPETATIDNNGSERSPSIRTENIAPVVTTQQPSIQFAPTSFTCVDKIHGGLYADVETGCSVFHICSVEPDGSSRSSRFVCGTGTLFNQKSRTCSAAASVDCGRSPSLYYLNEPFQSPDGEIDLCRTRPVGTPLADITTSCQEYTVCEVSEGKIVERRYPCKKGQVFSQLHRKCLSEKKVKCAKETLDEILGLGTMRDTAGHVLNRRKRGPRSLLHSYRFRRAAVPPLTNLVLTPGVQDARVRRALFNLAALQQWAQENAHHTSFIEVYTLHSRGKNNYYPKKINQERSYQPHSENNNYNSYSYVQRRKRQAMLEDAPLIGKSDIMRQSVTSTGSIKVQSKLPTTTIGKLSPSSSVVNAPVITETVTTTETLTVAASATAKIEEPTAPTIIDPATKIISSTKVTQQLETITITNSKTVTSTTAPTVNSLAGNGSASSITPDSVSTPISITSTPTPITAPTPAPTLSSTTIAIKPASTTVKTTIAATNTTQQPTSQDTAPLNNETQPLNQNSIDSTNSESSSIKNETMVENPILGTNNTTAGMENSANSTVKEKDTLSATTAASAEAVVETSITTVSPVPTISEESANSTVATTNKSSEATTENPTKVSQQSTSAGTTVPITPSSTESSTIVTPTTPPITRESLPETNFTCKDKDLEKFYPDTEVNCQVFHYCSPGFTQEQVLDIKFLCTNDTMFDVDTQKCENKENVTCNKCENKENVKCDENCENKHLDTCGNCYCNITTPPSTTTPTPPPPPPPTTTTPTPPPPPPPTTPQPQPSSSTTSTPATTPPTLTPTTTITTTTKTPAPTITSTPALTQVPTSAPETTQEPTPAPESTSPTTITALATAKETLPAINITHPLDTNTKTTSQTATQASVTDQHLTSPASSENPQVNTTIEDVPINITTVSPNKTSETLNPVTDIPTTSEIPSTTTTAEPTEEDIVTELGPGRELSLQQTESPSPSSKDSTNTEAGALTSVSSTESILRSTNSESSNSPSVTISPTQKTQSAR